MDGEDEELSDLFNEVFCLDLDWSFGNRDTFSLRELQAFDDLCAELARRLSSSKLEAAIWFLTQARHFVRVDGDVSQSLPLSPADRKRLRHLIEQPSLAEAFDIIARLTLRGRTLAEWFREADEDEIFDALIESERKILRQAGLNQRSVSIIADRTRDHRQRITMNIRADRSLHINPLSKSVVSMSNLARISVKLSDRRAPDTQVVMRSTLRLQRAKEKVIGLAMLWGDAIPLLATRDWGITSVFSTAAGATVMALHPRGDRDLD